MVREKRWMSKSFEMKFTEDLVKKKEEILNSAIHDAKEIADEEHNGHQSWLVKVFIVRYCPLLGDSEVVSYLTPLIPNRKRLEKLWELALSNKDKIALIAGIRQTGESPK
jgi:hypothetical protein